MKQAAIRIGKGEAQLFRRALISEAKHSAIQFDERGQLIDSERREAASALSRSLALAGEETDLKGSAEALAGAMSWLLFELEEDLCDLIAVDRFDLIEEKALQIARWAATGHRIKEGAEA